MPVSLHKSHHHCSTDETIEQGAKSYTFCSYSLKCYQKVVSNRKHIQNNLGILSEKKKKKERNFLRLFRYLAGSALQSNPPSLTTLLNETKALPGHLFLWQMKLGFTFWAQLLDWQSVSRVLPADSPLLNPPSVELHWCTWITDRISFWCVTPSDLKLNTAIED